MTPLLGMMSSGATGSKQSSFESIATVTAAGGETSLSFTSIPSTYKSLQIRGISKSNTAGTGSAGELTARFNGDTGSNYTSHWLNGNGTSAAAGNYGGVSNSFSFAYGVTVPAGATSIFGAVICDILDYASTTKNKTVRTFSGSNINTTSANYFISLTSSIWLSIAAVTSCTLLESSGFAAGTTFALYGIKG